VGYEGAGGPEDGTRRGDENSIVLMGLLQPPRAARLGNHYGRRHVDPWHSTDSSNVTSPFSPSVLANCAIRVGVGHTMTAICMHTTSSHTQPVVEQLRNGGDGDGGVRSAIRSCSSPLASRARSSFAPPHAGCPPLALVTLFTFLCPQGIPPVLLEIYKWAVSLGKAPCHAVRLPKLGFSGDTTSGWPPMHYCTPERGGRGALGLLLRCSVRAVAG